VAAASASTSGRGASVKTAAVVYLRALEGEEQVQRLRWQRHLRAPASEEFVQRLLRQWPLRAPAAEEPVQRLSKGQGEDGRKGKGNERVGGECDRKGWV